MRFAYADPPYLGLAEKFYGKDHPDAADYDDPQTHRELIERLCDEFPDGWAMSLHLPSLRTILPMCPDDVRLGAWVKPFASFKPGVNPAYAWEPVIFRGGRKRGRDERTVRDWCAVNIALEKGLRGAKPRKFVLWIIDLLGVRPQDELVDLFPGSGIVGETFEEWRTRGQPVQTGMFSEVAS